MQLSDVRKSWAGSACASNAKAKSGSPSRSCVGVVMVALLSPALEEAAVEPVPEQVGHDLWAAPFAVQGGNPAAQAGQHVLAGAQADLDLRHQLERRLGAASELAEGERLDHG